MNHPEKTADPGSSLTAYFYSDEIIRSRNVSLLVLHGTLDIPLPPERLIADWDKEIAELGLALGDVESLHLARTIVRWPDYARCAEAVSGWMQTLGVPDLLDPSDLALMACLGARYHFDAEQYCGAAFCNLFLSEDKGLDLHFPALGERIPLTRGTVVIFDTALPHAVIPRGSSNFNVEDFAFDQDCTQVFLTWELPISNASLARAMKVDFDVDAANSAEVNEQQVCLNGAPVTVCPATGQWLLAE